LAAFLPHGTVNVGFVVGTAGPFFSTAAIVPRLPAPRRARYTASGSRSAELTTRTAGTGGSTDEGHGRRSLPRIGILITKNGMSAEPSVGGYRAITRGSRCAPGARPGSGPGRGRAGREQPDRLRYQRLGGTPYPPANATASARRAERSSHSGEKGGCPPRTPLCAKRSRQWQLLDA
jgi:hypothetical protein